MGFVTLTGPNDFLRQRELDALVGAFVAEYTDMGLERLDGEGVDNNRLQESLSSMPFLTARKMVVLREPGKQKAFAENIVDSIKNIADTTDVIIVEPKLDKRLSYYKTLKKSTDFREYTAFDAAGLARFAVDHAHNQGGSLSSSDARLLIDRVGLNHQLVYQELTKLLTYEPAITRHTIELLTERMPQSTVFELLDATFSGNAEHAFALYKEQRALKVEPQAIIAMLAWQLNILAVVKAAGSRTASAIASEAKLSPFVVSKSQQAVRRVSLTGLKKMIADLLVLDLRLKSVSIDADEALQLYLLTLARG